MTGLQLEKLTRAILIASAVAFAAFAARELSADIYRHIIQYETKIIERKTKATQEEIDSNLEEYNERAIQLENWDPSVRYEWDFADEKL